MTRTVALVVFVLLCLSIAAWAQTAEPVRAHATLASATIPPYRPVWEPILLPNGVTTDTVTAVAVSPIDAYTVWLGSYSGLYQTTDGGQQWQRVEAAPFDSVFDLVIDPQDSQHLYVRSWELLYHTRDGGASWQLLPMPSSMCGLALTPADPERLYARRCGEDVIPRIVRSDNGGQSWITPTLNFTSSLDTLVVSPNDPAFVVGANFEELFYSHDGGAVWTKAPVGVLFNLRPVFEPHPPYNLYVGHWTGLLRSVDGGQSWQQSRAGREFAVLNSSPWVPGEIIGGNDTSTWRLVSTGDAWTVTAWSMPLPLRNLWRSPGDGRVIYAQTPAGLWRLVSAATTHDLFLPVVQPPIGNTAGPVVQPSTLPEPAQKALERLNWYRALVGAPPLQLHPALVAAAQNHANYSVLNADDPSAWANGPHSEVAGKPGFTGVSVSDRAAAADYPQEHLWWAGAEVKHGIGDPVASVDDWMATVYHRVLPLDPTIIYMGYGMSNDGARSDVMDFGGGSTSSGQWSTAQPYVLAYPADGQTEIPPSWGGGEWPDPLPPDVTRPVGYPFTLQGVDGRLVVDEAVLFNSAGEPVAVHPNPPHCADSCYALIAVAPLQPTTTYTVEARGRVGEIPFAGQWRFTTGAANTSTAALAKATPSTTATAARTATAP